MHTIEEQTHIQHSKPHNQNRNILNQHNNIRSDKMSNQQITTLAKHMMKNKANNLIKFKLNQ